MIARFYRKTSAHGSEMRDSLKVKDGSGLLASKHQSRASILTAIYIDLKDLACR